MFENEEWRLQARCADADTELFFPPRDKELYKDIASQAKEFCYGKDGKFPCPVLHECLWYAIESDEVHGIWGGMSHRERNAQVRLWQKTYKSKMSLKDYIMGLERGK